MYTHIVEGFDQITIEGIDSINLSRSCECGQSFRWKASGGGYFGVIFGQGVFVKQIKDSLEIKSNESLSAKDLINYFDLERDYTDIEHKIESNSRINMCLPFASGIRVFRQEPFEALISFIISANNNIKRISGIIERLCVAAGEQKTAFGTKFFTFPHAKKIAGLDIDTLNQIGMGYRAPYIKKSAQIIADGYDLSALNKMTLDEARKALRVFPGVGPKVADCILLFSLGHTDAFPIDVWIDRAMKEMFFEGEKPTKRELSDAIESLGSLSGIVQQYIFQYIREQSKSAARTTNV